MESTRRQFLALGGTSAAAFALGGAIAPPAGAATISDPISAAYIHIDLVAGTAIRRGANVPLQTVLTGNGRSGSASSNLIQRSLPFSGANVATNTLPTGWEWHGSSSPKSLLSVGPSSLVWRGQNTSSRYMGGVRTAFDVAGPGESVTVGMRCSLRDVSGAPPVSLRASLLRVSDSKSTLLERVTTHLEIEDLRTTAVLTAPQGGSAGYRLVLTAEAGTSDPNQSATVSVSDVVVARPGKPGLLGVRQTVAPFELKGWPGGTTVLEHAAPAQDYYLILKTTEVGWFGVPFTVTAGQSSTRLSDLLGADTRLTIQEIVMIAAQRWVTGWLGKLAGAGSWKPIRFMELASQYGAPRPESHSRLSRATGLYAAESVAQGESTSASVPSLDAPAETWAASYNADRWSHLRFQTDQRKYIRETTDPSGVRSELHFSRSLEFGVDHWLSCWFRTTTDVEDTSDSRKNIIFQLRYTKNSSGDNSALGPEFALEQLTGGRFCISIRSDGGRPVLTGAGTPAGISTSIIGPWTATRGSWQRLVARVTVSEAGAGEAEAWLNGSRLTRPIGPVGYRRDQGPKVRFGSYKFSDFPANVEYQNFEFGSTDLSSRIGAPLPI